MSGSALLVAAENSLVHTIGEIFHPIFVAVGAVLAFIYGLVPNYALAITLLTLVIMLLLTPLTVKSTKSMIAMQRLQPEIKKLQQKYKGVENRQKLNEELMRLYKEQGISPAGGCLPMFLQMPFLIILYDVIRGLTNTVTVHTHGHVTVLVSPRYIPTSSRLYRSLVAGHGTMKSFGMDLALKPFSHHASTVAAIPFFAFIAVAVGLQFIQMRQMNQRSQSGQVNRQMQTMQRIMPILFAYIYFLIPAGVVLYMIVSTIIRILTQEVLFRTGIVQPVGAERQIGAVKAKSRPVAASSQAVVPSVVGSGGQSKEERGGREEQLAPPEVVTGEKKLRVRANGRGTVPGRSEVTGQVRRSDSSGQSKSKVHPRSKAKRARKAR